MFVAERYTCDVFLVSSFSISLMSSKFINIKSHRRTNVPVQASDIKKNKKDDVINYDRSVLIMDLID